MSSLALSPVQTVPDFVLPGGDLPAGNDPVILFTVPGTVPARIESVFMLVQYGTDNVSGDTFVLRIVDISGAMLYSQASLNVEDEINQVLELCWSRQGVDTGADGGVIWSWEAGEQSYGFWSGRLPDMVVRPGSMVTLQAYRGQMIQPSVDLPITNVAVVYTTGVDATATASTVQPFLVPTTGG